MSNPQWEVIIQDAIHERTERLAVPGGWLICRVNGIHVPQSLGTWFIEDPEHDWEIE